MWQSPALRGGPDEGPACNRTTPTTHSERNVITMTAIAVVPAMPDRDAFMARVADRFRRLSRSITQVAKKAGNWFLNLTPVTWAWRLAKSASSKVWGWVQPGVRWTGRYVIRPAAIAAGGVAGILWGSKLLAILAGIGVLGLISVTIYVVRRRGKEKVVGLEVVSTGAPEEPEEKPKPKRKPRQRIAEAVDKVSDALEESAKVIDAAAKEAAKETIEAAKIEKATAEAKVEAKVETEEIIEAAQQAVAEANAAEVEVTSAPPANGGYMVQLPEGDLDPNETLDQRFNYLDELINAEESKPDKDLEYLCELQARQNLVHVRGGKHPGIKRDATVNRIHNDFKASLKKEWEDQHAGETYHARAAGHYLMALNQGAIKENVRFNKIRRLKTEHDKIKGTAV